MNKKTCLVVAPLLAMTFLASCGSNDYKVRIPDSNGLEISPGTVKKGEAYSGTISINTMMVDDQFLPDKLDKVTSGNKELQATEYTYTLKEDRISADFKIPAENIVGDVDIQLSLVAKKWYERVDWWNYTSEATKEDIGKEVNLTVNDQVHKARLIGVDEDVDDKDQKIHTTFEFSTLLSDKNGYSLATYWNDTNSKTDANDNYFNSSLRAALVGEGKGAINWFQYFGTEHDTDTNLKFSEEYSGKTVLSMLPENLVKVLKTPSKFINVYNSSSKAWEEQKLEDKLFLLAPKEIGQRSGGEASAVPYTYYENGFVEQTLRIKQQVKGSDGARTSTFKSTELDGNYEGEKYNYAGFNSSTEGEGGWYLLRSPYITHTSVHTVGTKGASNFYDCRYNAGAIAPAFCI